MTLKVLDLFTGAGGFTLAGEMAGGYETVAFCEIDRYAQRVLRARWPEIPLFYDVTKLKGSDVGAVDVITGGFPCQDVSSAGAQKGTIDGKRSSLFGEVLRLATETGRPIIVMENVGNLIRGGGGLWFAAVLHGLAQIGYDAEWHILPASYVGASHRRERTWIIAYPTGFRQQAEGGPVYAQHHTQAADWQTGGIVDALQRGEGLPFLCGEHDGVSPRLDEDRLKMMGNAVVPQVAACIMRAVKEAFYATQ